MSKTDETTGASKASVLLFYPTFYRKIIFPFLHTRVNLLSQIDERIRKACTIMCLLTSCTLTPWLSSASELYRPGDRRLSAKIMPTFADRGVSHGQCGGSPTAIVLVI
jgi:hypothetical protein